ncbi:MAG: T9SS type A sorting domain-containing protein [Ignavibacteria bacterium]|jgi:hypothetical protein
MKKILFIVIPLFAQFAYSQTIIYVNTTASGSNDGTSWSSAYTSLQSALDNAVSGNQIWVAAGTYIPTSSYDLTNSSRYYHFRLINGVELYGGFAGTEAAVSERTNFRSGEANETILSGDIGSDNDTSNNCYHVLYLPSSLGLTVSTVLDGFTIQDGNASGSNPHAYGGGIYSNGNIFTMTNCTVQNNIANSAALALGGGMVLISSDVIIENCFILNNKCSWDAGGIEIEYCSPTITNSVIANNSGVHGGGVYISTSGSPTFTNVTIAYNTTSPNYSGSGGGGGVWAYWGGDAVFNNSIIYGNTRIGVDNDIALFSESTIVMNYSCYNVYYSEGTFTTTNANITDGPQFVDAAGGDFRLLGISPCIDTGYDTYNSEVYDIRGLGYSRKLDKNSGSTGTIDMGAYEYQVGADPLPVELISFTASVHESSVILNWQTATEVNNYGFEIERNTPLVSDIPPSEGGTEGGWQKIGFINGHGNSNSPKSYSYTDIPTGGTTFKYRLKQIDFDGNYEYSDEVEVTLNGLTEYSLDQNYPNPFNPTTTINYQIPGTGNVTLKVYDVLGREVMTLVNEIQTSGVYSVEFNGSNLASGIYVYKLRAGDYVSVKKLMLLK